MTPNKYLGFQIARTQKALHRLITAIVRDYGLTVAQYGVLAALSSHDGLPARDLVDRLITDSSTIMTVIDHLEEKGLVQRRPSRTDRRLNHIHLTSRAREMMPSLLARTDELDRALRGLLGPEETETLAAVLARLHDFAVTQPDEAGIGRPESEE